MAILHIYSNIGILCKRKLRFRPLKDIFLSRNHLTKEMTANIPKKNIGKSHFQNLTRSKKSYNHFTVVIDPSHIDFD